METLDRIGSAWALRPGLRLAFVCHSTVARIPARIGRARPLRRRQQTDVLDGVADLVGDGDGAAGAGR